MAESNDRYIEKTLDSLKIRFHRFWGLYYETLQTRNLRNNGQISPQASAFILSVVLTNTLAYYGIHRLRIHNVFIVQALGRKTFGRNTFVRLNVWLMTVSLGDRHLTDQAFG
jgi:hypothetical protein